MIKHNVTQCREARGFGKSKLAYHIGVHRSYITKLENHHLEPSGEMMLRIAKVLRQPVESIFELVEGQAKTLSRPHPAADRNFQ